MIEPSFLAQVCGCFHRSCAHCRILRHHNSYPPLALPICSPGWPFEWKVSVSTLGLLEKPCSLGSLPAHALYPKLAPLAVQQSVHSSLAGSLSHSLQQLLQTSCPLLKPPAPALPLILRRWLHLLHYWEDWGQLTGASSASIGAISS